VKTFYHMGFVVADLKVAMAELSSAMGVEWTNRSNASSGRGSTGLPFRKRDSHSWN
jgi:hypothetical protein